MANATGPREWRLDAAATITTDRIRIKRMRFVPSAANDDVLVSDSAGNIIWEIINAAGGGEANAIDVDFGDEGHDTDGFVLTTLTTGAILYIWLV